MDTKRSVSFVALQTDPDIDDLNHQQVIDRFNGSGRFRSNPFPSDGHVDFGWVATHESDAEFDVGKNTFGTWVFASLRLDTHKIPADRKKAAIRIETEAAAAAKGEKKLTSEEKQMAKAAALDSFREPLARGDFRKTNLVPFAWNTKTGLMLIGTTSDKVLEYATSAIGMVHEHKVEIIGASNFAEPRGGFDSHLDEIWSQYESLEGFSHDCDMMEPEDLLGSEFLLWLMWQHECGGETIVSNMDSTNSRKLFYHVFKHVTFECPLGIDGKVVVTHDKPTSRPEAGQAIASDKLPVSACLNVEVGSKVYIMTFQAFDFRFKSFKAIPKPEAGTRQEKMFKVAEEIAEFLSVFRSTYEVFLDDRFGETPTWNEAWQSIHEWAQTKFDSTGDEDAMPFEEKKYVSAISA